MKKYVVLLFALFFLLSGCKSEPKLYKEGYLNLFDTYSEIVVYTQTKQEFKSLSNDIKNELEKYDKLFDIYESFDGLNNIKTINDNAGIKAVKVDKDIIELIKYSKEMYKKTDGNVNIAFGPVLKIWHDYREEGIEDEKKARLPSVEILKEANKLTDIDNVIVDEKASTVFLKEKGMSLDVGSIAKGYVTEKVSDYLIDKGYKSFLLNIGGNVKSVGSKSDGSKWVVAIQNPNLEDSNKYLDKLYFETNSLVTSGDYQRFYRVNGKSYNHIISKDTLMPSEKYKSVSVISKNSMHADAMSTALFNMDFDEGLRLAEADKDIEVVWVFKDMSIKRTKGTSKYVKK